MAGLPGHPRLSRCNIEVVDARVKPGHNEEVAARYFIVGIENSAPSLTPDGQRAVTVLVLV